MASFSRREAITRHIEYLIPIGDAIDEWDKAATSALREWEALNPGRSAFGDWARIYADDEHVIIRIEVKERA